MKAGPAPRSELWPYQSQQETELLLASSVAQAAPVTLDVVTGANEATVRFRRR